MVEHIRQGCCFHVSLVPELRPRREIVFPIRHGAFLPRSLSDSLLFSEAPHAHISDTNIEGTLRPTYLDIRVHGQSGDGYGFCPLAAP